MMKIKRKESKATRKKIMKINKVGNNLYLKAAQSFYVNQEAKIHNV